MPFVSKCRIISPERNQTMTRVTLQIPIDKYGTIATLAAVANMPIDKYVVQEVKKTDKSTKKEKTA